MQQKLDADSFTQLGTGYLPGLLGIKVNSVDKNVLHTELSVQKHHLAPNGYLHAGTVITLADTSCGYACIAHLPEGATNFTTIELKSNFLGTAREGIVECEAKLVHGGRNTQVWDALIKHRDTGKLMATFRCTQMILYPRPA
jgi:1,4-dihydroxy-2-naphthoyl-CoA hydrolase